jgi:hypothetical protein
MTDISKKVCIYCQAPEPKQRYDYAGNAAGVMCDKCWGTSALNPAKRGLEVPRIVIDVTGGIVQAVWADISFNIRVIDRDETPPEDIGRVINIAADNDTPEYVYVWESIPYGIQNLELVERIFGRTTNLF